MEPNVKIEFSIGKNNWLRNNLEDATKSLNRQFEKRHFRGKALGKFNKGIFTMIVKDSSIEIIKPYIDALVKGLRKDGETFIYNISETKEDIDEDKMDNFENVSRAKYLIEVVLTGNSLKDVIKNKSLL